MGAELAAKSDISKTFVGHKYCLNIMDYVIDSHLISLATRQGMGKKIIHRIAKRWLI